MSKAKTSLSKPAKDEEEAVKFLATLAARIAPALCLNDPKRAIEDAARLFECAREKLERGQEEAPLARERAQLEADAERRDKYGFKLKGPNLSLADAFALQERLRKGKRPGPYKTPRNFEKALREKGLIFRRLPKGTKEMLTKPDGDPEWTTTSEGVEETTPEAVMALFELKAERRQAKDRARKAKN
jgi:hypothetical protein